MHRRFTLMLACLALAGCTLPQSSTPTPAAGTPVPMAAARTFSVVERDGYRIVDVEAAVVDWAGAARGQRQRARLVLVPRERAVPALTGDLTGATVIRTPVRRIAANAGPHEAMLTALGIEDRLVAIGGTHSYNEALRRRVLAGSIAQIGYGWHSPPELDVLVAARPDLFLMAMGDLEHVDHLARIRQLGVPVVPTFIDAETDYMGRLDYVRLIGMLTGREREAEAYVARVTERVRALKALAASRPAKPMIWAFYARGDRWGATVRNAEARLIRDAGGLNLLEQPDDPSRDSLRRVSSEQLLGQATGARCWIIRDDQSSPFTDRAMLHRFRAWRERCLTGITGRMRPHHNAYDYYETAVIRPDLILEDLIAMLHPDLGVTRRTYIVPDPEALAL